MTDELVKRLDQINQDYDFARGVHGTIREAKDRVQALQAQNLRLSGMVHDLTKEVAISDALLISEAEVSLERLARAEKAEAERDRLIPAGDWLSVCAQTTGGRAGRDHGLVYAIQGWGDARAALKGNTND